MNILNDGVVFKYQFLSRLESDCKYFMVCKSTKYLYYKNIKTQISKMIELYNSFKEEEKPEWINLKKIKEYKTKMEELSK